ncbi:MAG: carboxypeptidase-like regulatory domain-containing protein, partial [Acidobacteria bacterium]|nr:carboxypeptidase-like regulatory domain-containing protein [Acidobacteriota bacterium]
MKDSSGASVAGARVKLVQAATGAQREEATNARGDFVVSNLPPGEYTLSVSQPGFKTVERKGLRLSASEILPADVVLQVGAVAETVTVTAQGAVVQTASAERAGLISSSQVENLLIRSRTVMGLLLLLPGVVDQGGGSESIGRNWNLSVNGNRRNTVSVSLDGATLNALGNNFNAVIGVSQDAIAEVKVLQTNYQAEYGRMSGANVTLVSKSGTRQFHGLGSYFKRHEELNANDFFNNRLTQPKARYRFNTWSYNVGGPVYIPEHFNRNKDKLFFFFSEEYWPLRAGQPLGQVTVP